MPKPTNVTAFFEDLYGGVFAEKLAAVLSEVATGVTTQDRKGGKVTIDLSFSKIGNGAQVNIAHKLSYSVPTMRGKKSEEDTTETPMYVGSGGALTLFPENQGQMFDKSGAVKSEVKDAN